MVLVEACWALSGVSGMQRSLASRISMRYKHDVQHGFQSIESHRSRAQQSYPMNSHMITTQKEPTWFQPVCRQPERSQRLTKEEGN